MRGTTVCSFHGGKAPQVQAKAAVNRAEQDLRRVWAALEHPPVDDPLRELQLLTGELLAWKELLRARIGELTTIGYRGMTSEQVRAEVQLYRDAVSQLGSLLTSIAKLRIDERLARIDERQAEIVLSAIDAGLAAADLDHTTRHVVRTTAGRHLVLVREAA